MATTRVHLLSRQVGRDAAPLRTIPRRPFEILCFLALRRRPIGRDELAAAIWPDLQPKAACNALHVTIHRLKRQLSSGALVCEPAGYVLGPEVVFDLFELERLAADIRGFHPLSPAEAIALETGYDSLSRPRRFVILNEQLAPLDDRCRQLGAELAERLAAHRLRSGETEAAMSIAETMLDVDPCDEAAWEIVIRSHLSRRRHADAVRAFQRYAVAIDRELGVPASDHLRRLLQGPFAQSDPAAARYIAQGAVQ